MMVANDLFLDDPPLIGAFRHKVGKNSSLNHGNKSELWSQPVKISEKINEAFRRDAFGINFNILGLLDNSLAISADDNSTEVVFERSVVDEVEGGAGKVTEDARLAGVLMILQHLFEREGRQFVHFSPFLAHLQFLQTAF